MTHKGWYVVKNQTNKQTNKQTITLVNTLYLLDVYTESKITYKQLETSTLSSN